MKPLHYITIGLFAASAGLASFSLTGCSATSSRESTGQYVDDSAITTKVKTQLVEDNTVKAREVKVETYKGVVQLSGFVDNQDQKDRAAQIASNVAGVREVKNNIEIKPMASQ